VKIYFPTLVAFLLLAAAGPIAAQQSPTPQSPAPSAAPPATSAPQPPERKAGERPLNLNLKLDDASRNRIMSGSNEERPSGAALPSLGGDARNLGTLRSDPYPKTSDNLP
jgi:hypothetical protein